MATHIHATAVVEDGAVLGENVRVMAHAVVTRFARLGDGVVVHPGAVIGGEPQHLAFDPATPSTVEIGAGTVLREQVTVNRSIYAEGKTTVGARCFLMAGAHLGHDCAVADDVVLANQVMMAGHVTVGSWAFVGGGAAAHQFCRIGAVAMVGGLARITRDVPPCVMVAERDEVAGLNVVGLKRRGWPRATIIEIKEAYRFVYGGEHGNPRVAAAARLAEAPPESAEARAWLEFFAGGKRGFVRPTMKGGAGDTE